MARLRGLVGSTVLTLLLCGCGANSFDGEVDATRLTVADSCGESFTVRDNDGTMRLTVHAPSSVRDGSDPATFELGPGGWTGELEVGSGLDVWPCHDVQSDFDNEHVRDVWPVVGGTIELFSPVVEDDGGGGSGAVAAQLRDVAVESPSQQIVVFGPVDVVNPSWGFYGG